MNINFTHIFSLIELKFKLIFKNLNLMVVPLLSIILVVLMKEILPTVDKNAQQYYIIELGLGFNMVLGGIMMGAYPISEEKEKNTLRTLKTSGITGGEFFLGSSIPPFIILLLTNIILFFLSNVNNISKFFIPYIIFSCLSLFISILLGFIIGIIAKNQTSAGIIALIPSLFLLLIPTFSEFNSGVEKVNDWLFTTPIFSLLKNTEFNVLSKQNLFIYLIWIVVLFLIFINLYKKNGFDY